MKVVKFYQQGGPEVLTYENAPTPTPGPGEILIKVHSASVNWSDVARRSNAIYPFPTPLPFIPGSEAAGTIEALGEGVDGMPVGAPVFALIGNGSDGYAQYAVSPIHQVVPIPHGVSMDQAASLPVAGTTAILILREIAQLQAGESVLVQGAAGGVGSYAVQLAKLMGAGKVIGATSSKAKTQSILDLGADHVIDYTQPDWAAKARDLTSGRGVDVVLEMSGGPSFARGLACLAPFGRSVVYGTASGEPLQFDDDSIIKFFYDPALNQSIHVFNLGLWFGMRPQQAGAAMGDFIGYVASGQVKANVNHVLPLSRAAEAHRMIEELQTTGKIVLKPWDEA